MSIEDDIKNVQELIDGAKRYGQYEGNKYYISMEHIISDYIMQKEIEKEHKKINEKLKIEIENLKQYIIAAPNLDEITAAEYEKIQKKAYIKGRADEHQKVKQVICKNYVPKQKIEDKIKEINKGNYSNNYEFKCGRIYGKSFKVGFEVGMLKALKELLQESED